MTKFIIDVDEKQPKKQVTITVDGEMFFSANLKVRNEQILDTLTQFFLKCVREDINIQEESELMDRGLWKK